MQYPCANVNIKWGNTPCDFRPWQVIKYHRNLHSLPQILGKPDQIVNPNISIESKMRHAQKYKAHERIIYTTWYINRESLIKLGWRNIHTLRKTIRFSCRVLPDKIPPLRCSEQCFFVHSQWSVTNGCLRHWRWVDLFSSSHFKPRPFGHYWFFVFY